MEQVVFADEDLRPTILLIEDESAVRESVRRVLRNEHMQFLEASDGREALRLVDQHPVDLILLDLQMPRMNGFEFLQRFRDSTRAPKTPVCVMTGATEINDRQRAIDLGADDFVRKPTEIVELKARIQSLLRIGRYQSQLHDLNGELEQRVVKRTEELQKIVEDLETAQEETNLAYREVVLRLSLAAEMKDECTAGHLERMSKYSALLATKCGWPAERVDLLAEAAKMHDIGKLGIPDTILNKPGKLTDEEFAVMQGHAEIGARILAGSRSQLLQMAEEVALTHHERFDGSGYPRGLCKESIPEAGRIVAIADVFDALMSRRSYKDAWSLQATVDALTDQAGAHFDPRLVGLFLEEIDMVCSIQARFADDAS